MKTVGELLESKGHEVFGIGPDATVYEALGLMAQQDVGALLVLEDGKLRGIISERNYARKVTLKGRFSKETPVREIMTEKVPYACPEDTIEECLALMTEAHLRYLPVFEGSQLAGIISIGDVGKAIISEQKVEIEQLRERARRVLP